MLTRRRVQVAAEHVELTFPDYERLDHLLVGLEDTRIELAHGTIDRLVHREASVAFVRGTPFELRVVIVETRQPPVFQQVRRIPVAIDGLMREFHSASGAGGG